MVKMNCERCGEESLYLSLPCPCKERQCKLCNKDFISYRSVCKKCRALTIWDQLRNHINNFKVGEIVTRQGILNIIGHGYQTTIDSYVNSLRKVKILEWVKPGKYLKHKNVPKSLTVGLMRKLACKTWESWFIPIDMIDELKGEKRGKNY